jgi:hypothetical protein
MRQTCIGALELERLVQLRDLHARALIIASLLGFLLSTEAAASIKTDRDSLLIRERSSTPSGSAQPAEPINDSSSSRTHTFAASANLYSEAYWTAVADLDLSTSRVTARNGAEADFAQAMALLTSGLMAQAESAFIELSRETGDLNVAVASQIMLARTLFYERNWSMLRDLPANSLRPDDRVTTADLERWGHAFSNIEAPATSVPDAPVSLKLRVTAAGTPAIKVRINGKEYEFWLDTGSTMTVLSSDVASAAQVPMVSDDTLTVRAFAGSAQVRPGLVRKMQVGPVVLTNSPVIIMDASMMHLRSSGEGTPAVSYHVDGILGWDFIRQFDVLLDYQHGVLTLAKPEKRDITGTAAQNLVWAGQPLVAVRTKDGGTLHLALDTGAQSTFLNAAALDKARVTTTRSSGRVFGIAKTGAPTNRIVPTLTVDVAGRSMRLENVIVYGPSYSGLITCDGILGSDVAQFGSLRIDATNGVFSVEA